MKKILALLMAVVVLAVAMPFSMSAAAADITTGEVAGKTFVLGDQLFYTDFEDMEEGDLPSGWEYSYTTTFGYGSGTGYANIADTGTSVNKALMFGATGVDTWISMPEIKTRNYVYEAVIYTKATGGSFGIANGMYGGIGSATGATYVSIPVTRDPVNAAPYYRGKGSPAVTKESFTMVANDKTYSGAKITLKMVSLDGVNYFYFGNSTDGYRYVGAYQQGESSSTSDWLGFYTYNGDYFVSEITVTEIITPEQEFSNVAVDVENDAVNLDVSLAFDKTNKVYKNNISGKYVYSDSAAIKFGMVYAVTDSSAINNITKETEGAEDVVFMSCAENSERLYFNSTIAVEAENLDKFYEIRPYVLVGETYIYSKAQSYSPARLANNIYSVSDEVTKQMLEAAFKDSAVFKGDTKNSLTFTLFADFHYKENMYIGSVADLRTILNRADSSNSAFIMSAGDFCNDFAGSPELVNTYLNYQKADGSILTAYNIYGNHELETEGNSMDNVTAALTNDENVVWGTEDGSFDSNIGYYYFENNGFRIICTDTNYSLNSSGEWEHNLAASYGAASGNTKQHSMGPKQLAWLEAVLTDAANEGIPCIVMSHDGMSGKFATSSPDAQAVRDIYARVNAIKAGTVIMSINGHHHTNHQGYVDGVFYFDMNTSLNGYWYQSDSKHYSADATYTYEEYDAEGNLLSTSEKTINDLYQAKNTWFFAEPLSAVVTVDEFGTITIDGMETTWLYDVAPATSASGVEPKVTSGTFWDGASLGHVWTEGWEFNETHHWHTCENALCTSTDVSLNSGYAEHIFEEVEDEKFLVEGKTATYYKSCACGAVSSDKFGEGVDVPEPPQIWSGSYNDENGTLVQYTGSGTAADPYLIETPEQLARMVGYDVLVNYTNTTKNGSTDKHYKLMADIYLNDVSAEDWYLGENINTWYSGTTSRFCGNLDGNGYTIYGIYNSGTDCAGLFPCMDVYHNSRYIKNLTISDSYISSTSKAGALAGRIYGNGTNTQTVENCHITDSVIITSSSYSAGLFGYAATNNTGTNSTVNFVVKNTIVLAKQADGSALTYGLTGTTGRDDYKNQVAATDNIFYATKLQHINNSTTSEVTNTFYITDLTEIKGETAKTTLEGISGFCFTEGYPMNKVIAQLRADVNCDGVGNVNDATDYRTYLIGLKDVALTDVNADDAADICDLVDITIKISKRK